LKVIFIRHGKTIGNIEKRYIGITDENLSSIGVSEIEKRTYPLADRIISSPLKRCIQTSRIIYGYEGETYYNLRECDFGEFENKNYEELKYNTDYIKWLESNGKMTFPNGESHFEFCERCCNCFEKIVKNNTAENIAFIVHGGTIMAILEKYSVEKKSFFDWRIGNGEFLVFDVLWNRQSFYLKLSMDFD